MTTFGRERAGAVRSNGAVEAGGEVPPSLPRGVQVEAVATALRKAVP